VSAPQPGIFAQGTRAHYHLEFDLREGAPPHEVADALARLREPAVTAGGSNLVIGFGPELWRTVAPEPVPDALAPFAGVDGPAGRVPATPHDIWVWLHGTGPDVMLDNARAVVAAIGPCAELKAEAPCFVYLDSRDITGFIDGTENPPIQEAPEVALVPDGEPGAGGSFVITIRWRHDLEKFHAQSIEEQEATIGRSKPDSVELDDKPLSAHISRVVIEEGGEELEIYRRSTPFGTVGEHGLYFIAFSADPTRYDKMLARMYGTTGDGFHDHLVDFTTPESGSYYFAPSLEALAALGE
jgi:putative iron-dependent peroxidase